MLLPGFYPQIKETIAYCTLAISLINFFVHSFNKYLLGTCSLQFVFWMLRIKCSRILQSSWGSTQLNLLMRQACEKQKYFL